MIFTASDGSTIRLSFETDLLTTTYQFGKDAKPIAIQTRGERSTSIIAMVKSKCTSTAVAASHQEKEP